MTYNVCGADKTLRYEPVGAKMNGLGKSMGSKKHDEEAD